MSGTSPQADGAAAPGTIPGAAPASGLLAAARTQLGASGSAAAADYLAVLEAEPGALFREGGPRHLTASAVVIDRDGDHLALVWHRKGSFWVQPGGHLEVDDAELEAAARREVSEEIGLEELERVGPGPAVLHRHALDAAFGACHEHWDVQYLLRTALPAAELPLRASEESPEVVWVPWPLLGEGPARSVAHLPPGTVEDMPDKLAELAEHLAAHPRRT